MKKNKMIYFIASLCLIFALAACRRTVNEATNVADEGVDTLKIALIADTAEALLEDGSFNEGAYKGIMRYLDDHDLAADSFQFFQPNNNSSDALVDLISDAVDWGATVLVLPGFNFQLPVYEAQDMYPEVKFILLDASPTSADGEVRVADNVAAIHYAEEEAGFLAGYIAVREGYRQLGFMGGVAMPAVVRYGHGFIQGAEYAAAELGLNAGEVVINYHYVGGFVPTPEIATTASSWFASGTEVIFAAAGGAGSSVMNAAEGANASVIGVDVDQSGDSQSVIFSAIKGIDVSVYDTLQKIVSGQFASGELRFDASIDGVGLIKGNKVFETVTDDDLNGILQRLKAGELTVNPTTELADLELKLVTVNER